MKQTYRVKMLAYKHGQTEAILDERHNGILFPDLGKKAQALVVKAIKLEAYEMILDIFEETQGAK